MMKSIKSYNFLGKKQSLLINKQESHQSLLGGYLFLLTILANLSGLGYFLSIFLSRETFTLLKSENYDLEQYVNISDFPIAFSIY